MDIIREYLMGILAAAMICAITLCFAGQGPVKPLLQLICGLVLTFTLIDPLLELSVGNWSELGLYFEDQGETAAETGKANAEKAVRDIIKQETESYILDKAGDLDLHITVSVSLSDQALPVPEAVTIHGTVPPYGKSCLSRIIRRELGIAKENQKWVS